MKFCVLIVFAFVISCTKNKSDGEKIKTHELTEIAFDEEMHNFGKLTAGEIVLYTFVFKNTGTNKYIIENIESDCGCIESRYSKKPVKPGEKGQIEVELNTSGLTGRQLKTIEIKANCKEPKQLIIFAEVYNEQIKIKS